MDNYYIDTSCRSITKYREELCGDSTETIRKNDDVIVVLSDGLGSGVKANILSTITCKIISTMMNGGASLEDSVETVVNTLPTCKVRKVAYSTFSVIKAEADGSICLTEFDTPGCIFVRDNKLVKINYNHRIICGHHVRQSHFKAEPGDMLVLVSDGIIYAGLGNKYPLGWGMDNLSAYVEKLPKELDARSISKNLCAKALSLYKNKAGDDATAVVVKISVPKAVSIFSGPPLDPAKDEVVVNDFMAEEGKKIVCGGSTASILARVINKPLMPSIEYTDPNLPPMATLEGVDLVTEGVITLKRTLDLLKGYRATGALPTGETGADKLTRLLVNDCTHLKLFIGLQRNPAHNSDELVGDLGIRMLILNDLYKLMGILGKRVTRKYY